MIGLGVLATGSGATALTGATLSNTVSPTADFRVNVDPEGLVVEKNSTQSFDGTVVGTAGSGFVPAGLAYHDSADTSLDDFTDFAAVANDGVNGDLEFGVLVPFDQIPTSSDSQVSFKFPDLLQVTNSDGSDQNVVIRYDDATDGSNASTFGYVTEDESDLDSDGSFVSADGTNAALSFDEVASIFSFEVAGTLDGNSVTSTISPKGANTAGNSNQLPEVAASIDAGGTTNISVNVNISPEIGQKIVDEVDAQNLGSNGGQIRLLDQVFFSTTNDIDADTVNAGSAGANDANLQA
jgi:hypothetical protein